MRIRRRWVLPVLVILPRHSFPTGGLAGHEPHEAQGRAGRTEAPEVGDLQEDGYGGQGVDAPEAPEPGDRSDPGVAAGQGGHLGVQDLPARPEGRGRQAVLVQGALGGGVRQPKGLDPGPPRLAPCLPDRRAQPPAEGKLPEPLLGPKGIGPTGLPAADEFPDILFLRRGDADSRQFARPVEARQFLRVPLVRLEPLAGAARDEARRDDLTGQPPGFQLPLERVGQGPAS
jgi:hypothetical protein